MNENKLNKYYKCSNNHWDIDYITNKCHKRKNKNRHRPKAHSMPNLKGFVTSYPWTAP